MSPQSYSILGTSLYQEILILLENYLLIIYTFQSSYRQKLMETFSELRYARAITESYILFRVNENSYWYFQRVIIKLYTYFSEFIYTDFFRVHVKKQIFLDWGGTNIADCFQINCAQQSSIVRFILINRNDFTKCLFFRPFWLKRKKMDTVRIFTRVKSSKIGLAKIYFQTKLTFSEISKQKARSEWTNHILYFLMHF